MDGPPADASLTVLTMLGEVSVRISGHPNAPAVLLLHANPGDSRDFDAIRPVLAADHAVVSIDWPGYGQSAVTEPDQVGADGLVAVAESALDVLARQGIRSFVIVGNSVGGYVAIRLAQRRGNAVAGLVLVDPGGFTPRNALVRAFCRRVMGRQVIARWLIAPMARAYLGRLRTPSVRATYARARQVRHDPRRLRVHCAIWRSFAQPNFDLTDVAPALAVPTLLVWGRRDPVLPAAIDGRRARRAMPGATVAFLRAGHESFNERPDEFLDQVRPFLRRVETRLAGHDATG